MLISLVSKAKLLSSTAKNVCLAKHYCTNKPAQTQTPITGQFSGTDSNVIRNLHKPDNYEKFMLVWTGRYKSKEEIPEAVPVESMKKAWNKMRIKIANYMIVATIIACGYMAYSGKKAAERGESVAKMNEEWHKKMRSQSE